MSKAKLSVILLFTIALLGLSVAMVVSEEVSETKSTVASARPALSVTIVQPTKREIPITLTANGSIAPWQEAIIGAEVSDLRLNEVRAQVGEMVKKGQVLATFTEETVLADIAQGKAALAEAEANLAEAHLNVIRAQQAAPSGAVSKQQLSQYLTEEKTAKAKVESAQAQLNNQQVRYRHTKVIAIADGVISSRSATLGAVPTPGQELFRLIRKNRLEWRAEVTAADMTKIKPGASVSVEIPNVARVDGTVRLLAPTLDAQNRKGLIYIDLPDAATHGFRAGMFAQGEFKLGTDEALTIPQEALSLRDGFSYVFRLNEQGQEKASELAKVSQVKVKLGRRTGSFYEIISGLNQEDRLVASGAAFLADGDTVRTVQK